MKPVRVALANIPFPSSRDDSVTRACNAIAAASQEAADLICFPECYVPGYRIGKDIAPPDAAFLERAWADVAGAARRGNVGVILGTERIVDGGLRISALVINRDGSVAGFQDKVQLDPSEEEESVYAPASERRVFHSSELTFGIVICI